MKYSLPEYSPFTKRNPSVLRNTNHRSSTPQSLEKYGIPDYSTVSPFVSNSAGYIRKPLVNPNQMPIPATPSESGSENTDTQTQPGTVVPPSFAIPLQPGTTTPPFMPTQPGMTPPAATMPAQPGMTPPSTTPSQPDDTIPTSPFIMPSPGNATPSAPNTVPSPLPPVTPSPSATPPPTFSMPFTTPSSGTTPMQGSPIRIPAPMTAPSTTIPFLTTPPAAPSNTSPSNTIPSSNSPQTTAPTRSQEFTSGNKSSHNNCSPSCKTDSNRYSCMPDKGKNPFQLPMGIPMMPLYGYDNSEDADKDWDYMKQLFPLTAKKIMVEIEDACDKLEYDGSCMFDEYPDRVYLGRIADKIFEKVNYLNDDPKDDPDNASAAQYNPNYRGNQYRGDNSQNRLRDLIEVLLLNEILNRRRRYRSRRRWF